MPRIECDKALQERLCQVVQAAGNPSAAATQLGLEKTLVWRFYRTGRAIPRSRLKLEAALDVYARQSEKKSKTATKNEMDVSLLRRPELSPEDFRQMRKYFQSMVAIMDFYEKSGFCTFPEAEAVLSAGSE